MEKKADKEAVYEKGWKQGKIAGMVRVSRDEHHLFPKGLIYSQGYLDGFKRGMDEGWSNYCKYIRERDMGLRSNSIGEGRENVMEKQNNEI